MCFFHEMRTRTVQVDVIYMLTTVIQLVSKKVNQTYRKQVWTVFNLEFTKMKSQMSSAPFLFSPLFGFALSMWYEMSKMKNHQAKKRSATPEKKESFFLKLSLFKWISRVSVTSMQSFLRSNNMRKMEFARLDLVCLFLLYDNAYASVALH